MHRNDDLPNPYAVEVPAPEHAALHYLVVGAVTAGAVVGGGPVVEGTAAASPSVASPAAHPAVAGVAGPVTAAEAQRRLRAFAVRLDGAAERRDPSGTPARSPALFSGPASDAVLETFRPGRRAVVEFLRSVASLAVTLDAGGPASPALDPGTAAVTGRELLEWGLVTADRMLEDLDSAADAVIDPPTPSDRVHLHAGPAGHLR